jgi:hypothetical protein
MELQGFACKRLEMTLKLDPDGYDARAIDLPAPTRDVKTMLTLIRLNLEKTPPGAPVTGFSFLGHPDRPRRAQLSLFGPAAVSPEKLATTIAKLVSMLGEGRVGMPMCVDGHLPERHAVGEFAPPAPPDLRAAVKDGLDVIPPRICRPPLPVEVQTRDDEIASVHGDGVDGSVLTASGPWRIEEGWWRKQPECREYWDVELEKGDVYRLYRAASPGEWYANAANY